MNCVIRHQLGLNCLGIYEEAVGTLTGLTVDQGFLIAQISKVMVALPIEMEIRLLPLIGKRIGILHTDVRGKEYLVRSFSETKRMEAIDQTTPNALKASA